MARIVYLHGFASSPQSKKAAIFRERLEAQGFDVAAPDLNGDSFRNLTLSGMLRVVEEAAGTGPLSLVGSSLGGYLAALYAARHREVEKLVLLAPAFGFARRWMEELGEPTVEKWRNSGERMVMNYASGREEPIGWGLMEDSLHYEDEPAALQQTLIFHGVQDDVVPIGVSRSYARTRTSATLREVESDHSLLSAIEEIWGGTKEFLCGAGNS
jgi:pimeloyl-ACP methyl ester carboxylesterase